MRRPVPCVRLNVAARATIAALAASFLLAGSILGPRTPALARQAAPSLILADHDAGQAPDAFTASDSANGAILFRFKLTAEGEAATLGEGGLTLAVTATGVQATDLSHLALIADADGDGAPGEGEASMGDPEAPLDLSDGGLTFSNLRVSADAAGHNYLLRADVANLEPSDSLTLSLDASGLLNPLGADTGTPVAVTGGVSPARHLADAPEPLSSPTASPAAETATPLSPAVADASGIVINEVVTDPQTDWSSTGFSGPGSGGITDTDEWVELYNAGTAPVDLTAFSLEFIDSSPETLYLNAPGTTVLRLFGTGLLSQFFPGNYLIIGNPPGSMNDAIYLVLRDGAGTLVDDVELGDDPEADGPGDGAPDGNAAGPLQEAVARVPNGADTDNDAFDFYQQAARLGQDNGGKLTLSEHSAGQAGNALAAGGPAVNGALLFRFRLAAVGEAAVFGEGSLTFDVAASGLSPADLTNLRLVLDADSDGAAGPGEASVGIIESPLDLADGITFSDFTVPAAGGTDYLLLGDINNLGGGETLGLTLDTAHLSAITGGTTGKAIYPTGAVSPASHAAPALTGQVVINEIVTDPQTDWSTNGFDGTPGGGTVSEVDEYVELYMRASGLNLTGWSIELIDSTPESGSLAAGGAFAVSRYVGAGSLGNTAAGDYLVLGNPRGTGMNNDIYLVLRDATRGIVDEVEIGDDFAADGPGDGAPDGGNSNGDATGPADEAIARAPDGRDTGDDPDDFFQREASPGSSNGGRLTLAESGGGQAGNAFIGPQGGVSRTVSDAPLYRFSLRAEGESITIGRLRLSFLSHELRSDNFGSLELIEDDNNNGLADPGEPVLEHLDAPINLHDGLTFTNVAVPLNPAGVGFLLRGSLVGLRRGDLLDVQLEPADIQGATGDVTGRAIQAVGAVSPVQHGLFDYTRDVLINEVLPHPGQDYNHDGDVSVFGDEYIELINLSDHPIHLGGWLLDDIPAAGSPIFHIYQGTIIQPHKVLVMFRGVTHLALNDDYDFVQLRYPDGQLADEVAWDHDPGVDASISRNGLGPGAFSFDWLPTPGMSNQARPGPGPIPPLALLAAARTWNDGAYLAIEGQVTGPYPLFGQRTIYVQDASGAGIVLYLADGDFPPMQAGQRVWAYGYLRTVTGERELYVKSLYQMSLGGPGQEPAPQRIATGAVGEATEGRLVHISGRVTRLENNAFWLDDGSGPARAFFAASTGLTRPAMKRGQIWEVTGIVSEFTTSQSAAPNYRVLVRTLSDLTEWLDGEPTPAAFGPQTLAATVGGRWSLPAKRPRLVMPDRRWPPR